MERRNTREERMRGIWNELNDRSVDEPTDVGDLDHDLNHNVFEASVLRMERYQVAGPSEVQTKALLARLTPLMVQQDTPPRFADQLYDAERGRYPLYFRFIRSIIPQVQLFSWLFWIVSALLLIVGAVVMPLMDFNNFSNLDNFNSFFIVSVLLPGISVFYALRSYGTPMGGLESTFPVSQAEVIMGRLSIILLYDIVLASGVSVMLSIYGLTGPLFVFIISWLVPLCLCATLAFVGIICFGTKVGGVISIAAWGVQLFVGNRLGPFYFISDTGYEFWETSRVIASVLTVILIVIACITLRSSGKGDNVQHDPA